MGNNHDKYFGSDKRKIIILGLQNAGKTSKVDRILAFLQFVSKETINFNTPKTKNLNIEDVKVGELQVTFFDLAGGERQRVFWKQQYDGTQGIIFIFDVTATKQQKDKSIEELEKLNKQFQLNIPFAIGISKVDKVESIQWSSYKSSLTKQMQSSFSARKSIKIFEIDYKNKESIKSLLGWVLSQTKPI